MNLVRCGFSRVAKLLALAGLLVLGLAGCGAGESGPAAVTSAANAETFKWKLLTTWPKNLPGLGVAPEKLAERIRVMSNGRLDIKVYGAGELVGAFEVFDAVSQGTAEMGHGAAYYWRGKAPVAAIFATVPFGMNTQEMTGWLHSGGGLELWRELYAPFNLRPFPGGNTGVQMAGWFNKEINSLEDLQGLKMRIPGLGGEVLERAGGVPVSLPGGEVFTSLQTGVIDATEWVGPYNDLAFGLHKAAKYYYYPGFHEPGTILEAMINKQAFEELTDDLQSIVLNACKVVNQDLLSEYTARNPVALEQLVNEHNVEIFQYPEDVLNALKQISDEVVLELANENAESREIYDSYSQFLAGSRKWSGLSERAYLNARDAST